jgi:CARDB
MVRRVVAGVALLVVLILIVVGVHSCQVSARNTAMRNYANNVSSLNGQSTATVRGVFGVLGSGGGSSAASTMKGQLSTAALTAQNQLGRAKGFDVPDEMKTAQQQFLLALQMRHDGIVGIADNIEQALGSTTTKDAVDAIAANSARFYSSDVIYKDYTIGAINSALSGAGIAVGGANGIQLDTSQALTNLGWLTPTYVANQLGSTLPSTGGGGGGGGKCSTSSCGHKLDSVSVGGTTLQTGSTNTLPSSPAPTFTLGFTNSGTSTETNVKCTVSVSNTKITGETTVPQTTPGQSTTCRVPLSSSPPPGNYTVTATIQGVAGETNKANNTLTFPVTFQ